METIVDAMAAAGTMKKDDRRRHLRELGRRAYDAPVRERPRGEIVAELAGIGIPVERV